MKPFLVLMILIAVAPLLAEEPAKPFNGSDLSGWKFRDKNKSKWVVGRCTLDAKEEKKLSVAVIPPQADGGPGVREMINPSASSDIYTDAKFGDCIIEVEVMVPKGSNSGIYYDGRVRGADSGQLREGKGWAGRHGRNLQQRRAEGERLQKAG